MQILITIGHIVAKIAVAVLGLGIFQQAFAAFDAILASREKEAKDAINAGSAFVFIATLLVLFAI